MWLKTLCATLQRPYKTYLLKPKDYETKPWSNIIAKMAMLSLRGVVSDEAILVFGQRLLRCARNDTLPVCHTGGVLSPSPKIYPNSFQERISDDDKLSLSAGFPKKTYLKEN